MEKKPILCLENMKGLLAEICKKTNTRLSGMERLIRYYMDSLGWSEEESYRYAIGLFLNGTIDQIKIFGKDGEER